MRMIASIVLLALCLVGCPKKEEVPAASLDVSVPVVAAEQFVPVEPIVPSPTVVVPPDAGTPAVPNAD